MYPHTVTLQEKQRNLAFALFFGKKKKKENAESTQENPLPPSQEPKQKPRRKGISVEKYEIVNDVLKFSAVKGLFKKRWIVVKEIPVFEITNIETFGNELTITWNDVAVSFELKKKNESFSSLRDQVLCMLEEKKKTVEKDNKADLRKSELAGLIDASVGIVDLSFDLLMELQVKRVNWSLLESYTKSLGQGLTFTGQTMPPLSLECSKISASINNQTAKETSKETLNALKSIYGYFENLKLDEDLNDTHPNFKDAKALISAYYTLNDLLLGKIVGEKDNKKEILWLETLLQGLATETIFKINVDELKSCIDRMSTESDVNSVVEDTRAIFKDQLKLI